MNSIVSGALVAFFVLSSAGVPAAEISAEVTGTAQSASVEPEYPTYSVKMTGYNPVPEQTDYDPLTTASGAYSNPEIIAARSRDLAEQLPYGTVIELVPNGETSAPCGLSSVEHLVGYRVVADAMHSRKRNQIDIMFDQGTTVRIGDKKINPAVILGVCDDIEVRVVGRIDVNKMPRTQVELQLAMGMAHLAVLSR